MTQHSTDASVLKSFKTNVAALLAKHRMTEADLSKRAGYDNPDAVKIILEGQELPSMAVPIRFAQALRVPVETLFRDPEAYLANDFDVLPLQDIDDRAAQLLSEVFRATGRTLDRMSDRPTMDAIIAWWKENNGSLVACDQLSPHFDLVTAAETGDSIPKVPHMGALGLSARTLKSQNSERLERFLATLDSADLDALNMHIRTVSRTGVGMVSPQTRVVDLPELDGPVEVSFVRLMLPVTDFDGQPFILNYSTLLSESTPSKQSGRMRKN